MRDERPHSSETEAEPEAQWLQALVYILSGLPFLQESGTL